MKKFFLELFKKKGVEENVSEKDSKKAHRDRMIEILFPIGEKFLVIGNNYQVNPDASTYSIMTVIGYDEISLEKKLTPIFLTEDGEEVLSFGVKLRYSDEIKNALDKLTAREAWALFCSWEREPY